MSRIILPGHHISVERSFYTHHGIYVGNGCVVELAKPENGGIIRQIPLKEFLAGGRARIVLHQNGLPLNRVVRNTRCAPQRGYDLANWNCEHFATWCSTHRVHSPQVEGVLQVAGFGLAFFAVALLVKALPT
jgi:hypothetical protein